MKEQTLSGFKAWYEQTYKMIEDSEKEIGLDFNRYEGEQGTTVSGLAKWLNPKLNRITKLKN